MKMLHRLLGKGIINSLIFVTIILNQCFGAEEEKPHPTTAAITSKTETYVSVQHLVHFHGPEAIINDSIIFDVIAQGANLSDPAIRIESTVTTSYMPPPHFGNIPIEVMYHGLNPTPSGGMITPIQLRSKTGMTKDELEDVFTKYLKYLDTRLVRLSQSYLTDLQANLSTIQGEIGSQKNHIVDIQNELLRFRKENGPLISSDELSRLKAENIRDLSKNRLEASILDLRLDTIKNSFAEIPQSTKEDKKDVDQSQQLDEPLSTLEDLLTAKTAIVNRLGKDHPEVTAIDKKIDKYLKSQYMRKLVKPERSRLESELIDTLDAIDNVSATLAHLLNQQRSIKEIAERNSATESREYSLKSSIKECEEKIAEYTKELNKYSAEMRSFAIVHHHLNKNQMGMITILDPAPKPEEKAEEKTAPSEAKDTKPAPDAKEETKPTSPAPAENPK